MRWQATYCMCVVDGTAVLRTPIRNGTLRTRTMFLRQMTEPNEQLTDNGSTDDWMKGSNLSNLMSDGSKIRVCAWLRLIYSQIYHYELTFIGYTTQPWQAMKYSDMFTKRSVSRVIQTSRRHFNKQRTKHQGPQQSCNYKRSVNYDSSKQQAPSSNSRCNDSNVLSREYSLPSGLPLDSRTPNGIKH